MYTTVRAISVIWPYALHCTVSINQVTRSNMKSMLNILLLTEGEAEWWRLLYKVSTVQLSCHERSLWDWVMWLLVDVKRLNWGKWKPTAAIKGNVLLCLQCAHMNTSAPQAQPAHLCHSIPRIFWIRDYQLCQTSWQACDLNFPFPAVCRRRLPKSSWLVI